MYIHSYIIIITISFRLSYLEKTISAIIIIHSADLGRLLTLVDVYNWVNWHFWGVQQSTQEVIGRIIGQVCLSFRPNLSLATFIHLSMSPYEVFHTPHRAHVCHISLWQWKCENYGFFMCLPHISLQTGHVGIPNENILS